MRSLSLPFILATLLVGCPSNPTPDEPGNPSVDGGNQQDAGTDGGHPDDAGTDGGTNPPPPNEPGGCNCNAMPLAPLAWGSLAWLALQRRRSRRH